MAAAKFEIGQRVRLSKEGVEWLCKPGTRWDRRHGNVVSVGAAVEVLWDRHKTTQAYHPDLLQVLPNADEQKVREG